MTGLVDYDSDDEEEVEAPSIPALFNDLYEGMSNVGTAYTSGTKEA